MSRKKRKYEGHEYRAYGALKGKLIRVYPQGIVDEDKTWVGRLEWIDVYTIGVAFNWEDDPSAVSIVYKNSIRIDPIPDNNIA